MCAIIIHEEFSKREFDEKKILLESHKIKKNVYNELISKQYKYFHEKKGAKEKIFEHRCSYRNDMTTLSEQELADIVMKMTHAKDYRPTPMPGNLNFMKVAVLGNKRCKVFNFDDDRLHEVDGEEEKFYDYLHSLTVRSDIRGKGGTYFFPMVNIKLIEKKYHNMAEPLIFITIGCLLQNFVLLFNEQNICSCIHFGVKEVREWNIEGEIFCIPCLLRAGYAEEY